MRLELAVLDQLDDLLRQFLLDADAHADVLLDLVAAYFLYLFQLQAANVDAAFREFSGEDVAQLTELEVVVRVSGQFFFLLIDLDPGVGALEVEAVANLLVALIYCVVYFDLIHLGHDVEGWHFPASFSSVVTCAPILPQTK
ncbi:hypothetical protein D3C83_09730 [compost metagenome]